ncbi:MBL fold metallo-hydrolase [Alkalihalobacterium chitinilyticum]|uniref:MBL fold metallo-hydrolase n=1 Tax=Alkalihalobacterium chitinilyticum TaxID=2980103 RepID=A0ABT5V8J2_9BACI|nr:MBL fold metallo-hydrolase [Alkalihalobacterium chitinilyticum]MDE5411784.1 MBL fold metallo-hydrolase [Alkalihalobacterium chitinilyticum]
MRIFERDGHTVYPIVVPANYGLETCNFYLLKHGERLTLIDAGMPDKSSWQGLMEVLEKNNFHLHDITEILLTHHHIDHVGLVNQITEKHSVPVYAHPLSIPRLKRDNEFLKMRVDFFEQLYREMDCGDQGEKQVQYLKASLEKNDNQKLAADITPIQGGMRLFDFSIIEVPGHAPDQIAFVDEARKWCFAGDQLIKHISSNAIVEPDLEGNRIQSLIDYKKSLTAFRDLNVDLVFSGHGELIDNSKQLIEARLEKMVIKSQKIKKLIKDGISTGNAVAQHLYERHYEKQFPLVMSEITGHLDALEAEGQIGKRFKSGVWFYYAV